MAKVYTKGVWVDEVLAEAAKYTIKDDAGDMVYFEAEVSLSTDVTTPGTTVTAARMNNIETAVDSIDALLRAVATEKTVSGGVLTVDKSRHKIQPETSTADDINTITGMEADTTMVLIVSDKGTDTLTFKHGTGNISCPGAADIAFSQGAVICYFDGTTVYVSGGGGGGGLANIVEDITPQLGGDLDMNGKNIDFPTTANISDVLDEDNMASNSATKLATQQSIKAYADTKLANVVEDTTPQLGGNLDLNGHIISTLPDSTGWTLVTDSWAYASATTITVPSGADAIYSVGDKIRLKQGAGYKYFYVITVADTLLTVTGGSDYTVATPTAITDVYYSKVSSPVGFPQYFNYTPTGISATNVTITGRFSVNARTCKVDLRASFTGSITFTTHPTLPIRASASYLALLTSTSESCGHANVYDQSAAVLPNAITPQIIASSTVVSLSVFATGVPITATVPITWANLDALSAHFSYEI